MTIGELVPVFALLLGSGAGVTAIMFFVRAGREMQKLEDRAEQLDKLEKRLEEREELDVATREHVKKIKELENLAHSQNQIIVDRTARLHRIERFFSVQFPRARTPSHPQLPAPSDDDTDEES